MRSKPTLVALVFFLPFSFAHAQQIQRGPMRLRITPADTLVANNGTVNYVAKRSFFRGTGLSGGERDINTSVAWSAANPNANPNLVTITAVGPTGATATAAASGTGTSTIFAKSGPNQRSAPLQVTTSPAPTLNSVAVTPGSPSVPRGTSLALKATATYSDTSTHDVTFESTWSSGAPANVRVVPTTGQVQALGPPSANITATFNATPGSTTVFVGMPVLASRLISPANAGPIDLGSSQQFQLTDTMSDGTTAPQTASASWTTGSNTIATVNSTDRPGFATATGGGFTTVTAAGVSPSFPPGTMSVNLTGFLGVNVPKPRYAFGINQTDKTISIFLVNAVTGQLTTVGYIPLGSTPGPLTIDPSGRFAYVPLASGSLLGFTIDNATGSLTPVPGSPYPATLKVVAKPLRIDPKGKFLYAITQGFFTFGIQVFAIDSNTGALTAGGAAATGTNSPTTNPSSTTIDPSGQFAFVTNMGDNSISSFTLDPVTGSPTSAGTATTGTAPSALWLHPSGRFAYVTNQTAGTMSTFQINGGSGALTGAGAPVSTGTQPSGVTVDPSGRFVFAANNGSNNVTAYTADPTSGALTAVGTVSAGTQPASVKVDPQGQFLYVPNSGSNDISTYSINGSTGALTPTGTIRAQGGTLSLAILNGNSITPVSSVGYIGNVFSNNISAYYLDPTNGTLSSVPGSPFATGGLNSQNCTSTGQNCQTGSGFLGIEPTHKFAYLANAVSQNLSAFSIDAGSGALSPIASSPFLIGGRLRAALAHPFNEFIYVTDTDFNNCNPCLPPTVQVGKLDPTNGAPTPKGSFTPAGNGGGGEAAAIDPSGRFLYWEGNNCCPQSSNIAALKIDPNTGLLTDVQGSPFPISGAVGGGGPDKLTIDPSGRFLIVVLQNNNNSCTTACPPGEVVVFRINTNDFTDPTAGALTPVGLPFTFASGFGAVSSAVDPTGRFAYIGVTSQTQPDGTGAVKQFSIDPNTGALTGPLQVLPTFGFVTVAFDPAGKFAYVLKGFLPGNGTDNVSVFTVDQTTGALSTNVQNLNTGASGSAGMTVLRRTQ